MTYPIGGKQHVGQYMSKEAYLLGSWRQKDAWEIDNETSGTVSCKVGCNWSCRSLQNNVYFWKKNTKNSTIINYWSALLSIIEKHYTETMHSSIQSLIIGNHHDIPICGLISLLLFSLLHNLIVVPSLCRVDDLSLYVQNNTVTQSGAAQMAENRVWNRSVY